MNERGRVGPVARALGFAGLLPQAAVVLLLAAMRLGAADALLDVTGPALFVGVLYPCVILSFLGGTWWGFAMRREQGQGALPGLAVVPSLTALVLIAFAVVSASGWSLVAIGCMVIATLFVDRDLVSSGEAPEGWMELRVPLSLGLGGLTIAAGALLGTSVEVY